MGKPSQEPKLGLINIFIIHLSLILRVRYILIIRSTPDSGNPVAIHDTNPIERAFCVILSAMPSTKASVYPNSNLIIQVRGCVFICHVKTIYLTLSIIKSTLFSASPIPSNYEERDIEFLVQSSRTCTLIHFMSHWTSMIHCSCIYTSAAFMWQASINHACSVISFVVVFLRFQSELISACVSFRPCILI